MPLQIRNLAIVVIAAVVPFLSSTHGDFVLDDDRAVRDNPDVSWEAPIKTVFENDFWGTPIWSNASHKSWRPATVLSFKLTDWLMGKWPPAYHISNIALHAFACVLFLYFCQRHLSIYLSQFGQLSATIIFAVHPAHVENVASIVGRADVLCFIFMYLSIHYYIEGRHVGFLLCYALSFMSKELGILTPIMCLGYHLVVRYKLIRLLFKDTNRENNPFPIMKSVFLVILTVLVLMGSRAIRGHRSSPKMSYVDNPIMLDPVASPLVKMVYYMYVHSWYFITLVFPYFSCSDWGYNVFPGSAANNWFGPLCAIAVTYSVVVVVPLLLLKNASSYETREFALICLCLLVVPFLPASGLIPVGTVLAERLLYIPSVGFALAIGKVFEILLSRTPRFIAPMTLTTVAAVLSVRTWNRSSDWNTPEQLFLSTIKSCPASAKAQFSLGVVYMQRDDPKSAEPYFANSLQIHPSYAESLVAMGRIERDYKNNLDKSIDYFQRALVSEKANPEAHEHLGISLSMAGDPEKGVKLLERALQINKNLRLPPTGEIYGNYGTALGMAKRYKDSAAAYSTALTRPGSLSQRCSWRRNFIIILKTIPDADQHALLRELREMATSCGQFVQKAELAGYVKAASELEAKLR